jgi:hypothetical protein
MKMAGTGATFPSTPGAQSVRETSLELLIIIKLLSVCTYFIAYVFITVKGNIKYCVNFKRKVLQCNANIKFPTCLVQNIVPKYAVVKVTGNTTASFYTKQRAQRIRIQN